MKKVISAVVVAVLLFGLILGCAPTPTPAPAPTPAPTPPPPPMEPQTWLFNGSVNHPQSTWAKSIMWFGDEVEKRTDGLIKFEYTWMGSLSPPAGELESVRTGVAQVTFFPIMYYPTDLFLLNSLQGVPFGPTDPEVQEAIGFRLLDEFPELAESTEQFGSKLIFFNVPVGFTTVMSTTPFTKLEDLEGKKIAVSGIYYPKQVEAAGATPLSIMLPDRPMSLETGMIDGSALNPHLDFAFGFHDITKHELDWKTGFFIYDGAWTIGLDVFNGLPEDIQEIILEVAREGISYHTQEMVSSLGWIQGEMAKAGVVHRELSDEDVVKWAKAMGNMPERVIRDGEERGLPITRQIIERYLELSQEAGHKFPVDWATLPVPD